MKLYLVLNYLFHSKVLLQAHLILFTCRLKALYDIRPRADEIEMISKYQQDNPKGKTG